MEGGVDASIFENFIFTLIRQIKTQSEEKDKDVIIFMDNARIHKHQLVLQTIKDWKVHVLFNAQYSPWINPVEQLFGAIKRHLRTKQTMRR